MDQQDQINSVIVKITMDGTESAPRFVVEEVIAQPGSCFEGAENLLRARFECLCCKTGYVVLPLIMQTAPIRTEMEVSIAEDDPTPIQEITEYDSEGKTGITLDEVVDLDEEQKQDDEFDDVKMEAELLLPEDSFEMVPLDNQVCVDQMVDLEEGDFGRTPSECPLDEVVNSDEGDGHAGLKMEADMTFLMDIDQDSIEMPPVKQQFRVGQTSKVKESDVRTPSKEQSLKLQCLRSKVVIRLDRIDMEDREVQVNASVAPIEPQERNAEGVLYQCDICKAFIKYRESLAQHMNIHLDIRFSCSECQASFSQKNYLSKHKKDFHQSEFRICEVCGWSQSCTKADYYSHLRRRHPEFRIKGRQPKSQNFNADKFPFPCIYCEPRATFASFEELKEHLGVTHDRNFACTLCDEAFNQQFHLRLHTEAIHDKKFNCPKCYKGFELKKIFQSHLKTHE